MTKNPSLPKILLIIFTIFWGLLAIDPLFREVWVAENIILFIGVGYAILTYKTSPFSNQSYWLIFIFCILQTIGAHYTYAEVPLGFWVADLLEIERNHYDRLVHFSFGLLLVLPLKEVLCRSVKFANLSVEIFVLVLIFFGIGAFYEILEWLYALIYEQNQAPESFLGSQGDIWDAEKDMLLNTLGALAYLIIFRPTKRIKSTL